MRRPRFPFARHRFVLAVPCALALCLIASPASANPQDGVSGAQQAANAAKKAAQNAKDAANNADTALAQAKAALAAANASLALLNAQISALHVTIASDTATLHTVDAELANDQAHLAAYLRQSYESGGSEAMLAYIISANTIAGAIQRDVQVNEIASASQQLVTRIGAEETKAANTLAQNNAALAELASAQEQAITAQAVIKVQEQDLLVADIAAHKQVSQAQKALSDAVAALAAARARDAIYPPVPGPLFTIDTNLTLPSGETAASLNQFLAGSALAGLGDSFMQAEATYHVSARYFVAHAILEFGMGHERDRAEQAQPLRVRRRRGEPVRRRDEFPELRRVHPVRRAVHREQLPDTRRLLLPRPHAARDERGLRERPQLGREDREHRRHDPADHSRPLSPIRRGTGTSGLRPLERTARHR